MKSPEPKRLSARLLAAAAVLLAMGSSERLVPVRVRLAPTTPVFGGVSLAIEISQPTQGSL